MLAADQASSWDILASLSSFTGDLKAYLVYTNFDLILDFIQNSIVKFYPNN